jgi:hypothetical protein
MDVVIDQAVQMLGGIVAAALVAVLVKLFQRFGIALDEERRAQLENVARQAVARAEEWAAAQAKGLVKSKIPDLGAAKFQRAVTDVVDRIPRVSREEAEDIVTAALPQMGLGAAAGAAVLGKALQTK